jgi:glycosyltransferase involved in cell wall biosynthesis
MFASQNLPYKITKEGLPMKEEQKTTEMSVTIILPAYNEEEAISKQIEAIGRVLQSKGISHEIIVVDDGSQDTTAELALQTQARVLRHSQNRGYGAALKTGIFAAKHDTIVIIDADGTYPADQIPNLLNKLEHADMAVGARVGNHVKIPLIRRPAKWLLGMIAARIARQQIPDLNSGMRAFRRDCVKQYFTILPDRFSFTTTITLALMNDNYRVVYHPINYHRRTGKSKITPWNFMEFMMLILRIAILFQPLRIFFPLALIFSVMGTMKIIFDILAVFQRHEALGLNLLYQPVISTSSILLVLTGLQLLLIGMVSDALLRRFPRYHRQTNPYQEVWLLDSSQDSKSRTAESRLDTTKDVSIAFRQTTRQD